MFSLLASQIIERVEDIGNGYGWSIIRHGCGEYEIAILKDGDVCYDTPLTEDVIRGDWDRINDVTDSIAHLEKV